MCVLSKLKANVGPIVLLAWSACMPHGGCCVRDDDSGVDGTMRSAPHIIFYIEIYIVKNEFF
jgi:hypothetical protein